MKIVLTQGAFLVKPVWVPSCLWN